MVYVATQQNAETTTEAKVTTTVNKQTSSADSDLSTVTNIVSTVTDSQTQTGIHCTLSYNRSCITSTTVQQYVVGEIDNVKSSTGSSCW